MFRCIAKLKFKRLQKKIREFNQLNLELTPDNWPEYKAMLIESLLLANKVSMNCNDNILHWNAMATLRCHQDEFAAKLPVECYTDLFVTLSQLTRKHNPEICDEIRAMQP